MTQSVVFRVFQGFNDDELRWAARSKFQLNRKLAPHFRSNALAERIVHELAERCAINVKELLESFETFARVRKRLRAPRIADVCCGHGLTGLLFAAVERRVEEVVLYDHEKPPKADLILEAVVAAAPWVEPKVKWATNDAEAGDVVFFSSRTIHCAWSNMSNTLAQVSAEIRYEPRSVGKDSKLRKAKKAKAP